MGSLSRRELLFNPNSTLSYTSPKIGVVIPANQKGRSFRRLATILGVGLAASGIWFGIRYFLYRKRNDRETTAESANHNNSTLANSTSGAFSIENTLVATENIEDQPQIHVVLHQCPRGYYSPSISPFHFNLETYLRVARIPYKIDSSFVVKFADQLQDRNSHWLTINGRDIVEPHECIPELNKTFGVDLAKHASKSRQTACRLISAVLELKIHWAISLWRWVFDEGNSIKYIQPLNQASLGTITEVCNSIKNASSYHALSRLPPEQIFDTIMSDLKDIASALGKHDYFLGSNPGEVDCATFALLSQMVWNMPGSPYESGIRKFDNLMHFVLRMKDNYWPDWDSLLQPLPDSTLSRPSALHVDSFENLLGVGSLNHSAGSSAALRGKLDTETENDNDETRQRENTLNHLQSNHTLIAPNEGLSTIFTNADHQKQLEAFPQQVDGILEASLIVIARKIKNGMILSSEEEFKWNVYNASKQILLPADLTSSYSRLNASFATSSYPYYYQPSYQDEYQQLLQQQLAGNYFDNCQSTHQSSTNA